MFKHKRGSSSSTNEQLPTVITTSSEIQSKTIRRASELHFFQGGVPKRYEDTLKWIGRLGFIAKGIVYGCIGVLTLTNLTGAWTPNGSAGNESPQGAFLLLGGIPSVGRPILIVMAVGLCLYIIWRFWEAITGQGSDASFSKKKNFFRYRLSPFVSGIVYTAYAYYVIHMIFQTEEEQQTSASSKTFPASWTGSGIGKAGIVLLGIAFLIAFFTQMINAVQGTFIKDLKTSEPSARKWEAFIIHTMGRIGFFGRAALFGTMSGFFWDSLAKRNESGDKNMVAAAVSKLANSKGGRFFMVVLGVSLVIYASFAVLNAYYKYFPTPPPTRQEFYTNEFVHPELSESDIENQVNEMSAQHNPSEKENKGSISSFFERHFPSFYKQRDITIQNDQHVGFLSKLLLRKNRNAHSKESNTH
ncbi:hypothetical protein G6F57_001617 [Rhizopus arrhizus]|uniref:DUF1206 domain-containing protein n=1 Tax=Rhizopus oryzae TaxID=64495 RepID=A0A9P6XL78_RHIOR|nr:hypothetical protein G6F30_000147 [Rhizopus arrhizus]KAG1402995.1 hypothetical protein G6F58_010458 [Rhizopus delemar]KAG0990154.1 hypothetical protein G6F29_000462 [Rhizopus arrhizus]KAG0998968.1 hypothetical protein G6F28_001450 [Rhizopus arrhizus]KAG1012786.1 hypothetical protein G6F27_002488 [Rhizopus arrhizus]